MSHSVSHSVSTEKAVAIRLGDFTSAPMRAFHMTWFAFFLCFFGWFGIAPLMAVVRDDLKLTPKQVADTVIASVAITIVARLLIGWLCDRIGPRRCYTALLCLGAIPVMCLGLAHDFQSFLLLRLAIGVIGASFVVTQFHTSQMFAPNCVGTANATTAGWGNMGGGIAQMAMPALFGLIVSLGATSASAWRIAMIVPGALMFVTGIAYYRMTKDTPEGNYSELKKRAASSYTGGGNTFGIAMRDPRVWALFIAYAACFGIELTINNTAALYFHDEFGLGLAGAGIVAGLHGSMNVFARTLGGYVSDKANISSGLRGRVRVLFITLLLEGVLLVAFSRMGVLTPAIAFYLAFSLFVSMSCGATYAIVPMLNKRALGSIAGIVGAGGNMGALCAGFLMRTDGLRAPDALLYLGGAVLVASFATLAVRFSVTEEAAAREALEASLKERARSLAPAAPATVFNVEPT